MFEADISHATVMAIYLLPANMDRLLPKFLALRPGTRIVANTFGFEEWDPDARETVDGISCSGWCEALLWIVPRRVSGPRDGRQDGRHEQWGHTGVVERHPRAVIIRSVADRKRARHPKVPRPFCQIARLD